MTSHPAQPTSEQAGRHTPGPAALTAADRQIADRRAMVAYLGVPFLSFLPPLAVYLTMRRSPFVRRHAAQALNLSITVLLYNISALILGGLLALDTVQVALLIVTPLVAGTWLVALVHLIRAAIAADVGGYYEIPGWMCATLVR